MDFKGKSWNHPVAEVVHFTANLCMYLESQGKPVDEIATFLNTYMATRYGVDLMTDAKKFQEFMERNGGTLPPDPRQGRLM